MYLKSLTINGFKSFAKKGELSFSDAITAIVGPNGSGKSNVAESFRFVLGEQSVKSLRGKRGEDLIWGGTDAVSRANRASVRVVFDNADRTFDLDFAEVVVERIVHRDGQNEYKINDSSVRLKDVQELLAAVNVGPTGHHIISQGEADRILSAGAKERREMIEDALGLKVYQLKKAEAARKLEKTHANIAQTESLRREAAPHLKYLKKQVERAEQARNTQAELATQYKEYLRREDTYIAYHYDRLTAARREPAERREALAGELEAAKALTAKDSAPELSEAVKAAEREQQAAEAALRAKEQQRATLLGQQSLLEKRIAEAETPGERPATLSRSEVEALVAELDAEIAALDAQADADAVRAVLHSVRARWQEFLHGAETVIDTSADEAQLATIADELARIAEDIAESEKERAQTVAKVEAARTAREAAQSAERKAERTVYELMAEARELETRLSDIDRELMMLERDRDEFKRELQEAVVLIGRQASGYFNYEIANSDGATVTKDEIVTEDRSQQRTRQRALEKLKIRLEELGVGATEELVQEYEVAKERDAFLAHEIADLERSISSLEELITDLETQLHEQFASGIEKISTEFNRFFTLMFGGGSAALDSVTLKRRAETDEAEAESVKEYGIELAVKLPNKRVSGLEMLSGGERALTSIALIFAMSQVNPPPFIILDETDAALDEANSRRYGDLIEALASKSQLILITHNRETMSRAGVLYGVTMGADGVSKLLSVKFDEAAKVAK